MPSHVIVPRVWHPPISTFSLCTFSIFTSVTFKLFLFNRLRTVFTTAASQPFAFQSLPHSFQSRWSVYPSLFRVAGLSTSFRAILFPLKLLRTLLHDFAFFLRSPKTQLFCFQPILHSLPENARHSPVGSPLSPFLCLCGNPFLGGACPDVN